MIEIGLDILWVSNSPFQFSGYATVTKELTPRINERSEHNITLYAMSGLQNSRPISFQGMPLYPASSSGGNHGFSDIDPLYNLTDSDIVCMAMDAWIWGGGNISNLNAPFVSYAPIDHSPLPQSWINVANQAVRMIPYSEFGERQLEEAGLNNIADSIYHGVDPERFRPISDVGPENIGFKEDTFLFGIIKNNQGTRCNYAQMLEAYRMFLDRNEGAREDTGLYIHANITGQSSFNLEHLVKKMSLQGNVRFVDQIEYRWGVDPEKLAMMYNAIDVALLATRGEGWGLTHHEAMACGTPAIFTDYSTQRDWREDIGWKVKPIHYEDELGEGSYEWSAGKHSKRAIPDKEKIVEAMEHAYNNPEEVKKRGNKAREWAKSHTWSDKADEFIEFFDELEKEEEECDGNGPISMRKRESGVDQREFQTIFDHLKEHIGESVLEVGCGSGQLMQFLSNKGFEVSGLDVSSYAIDRAKQRGLDNLYTEDMRELDNWFGEDQFECVVAQHSVEHIPEEDRIEVIKNMVDITKKKVFIICPSPAHKRFNPDYPEEEMVSKEEVEEWKKELKEYDSSLVVNSFPEGEPSIDWGIEVVIGGSQSD